MGIRLVIDIGVDRFCVVSAIATAKNPATPPARLLSVVMSLISRGLNSASHRLLRGYPQ